MTRRPFPDTETAKTSFLWPAKTWRGFPVSVSQVRTVPSRLDETAKSPAGEKAKSVTGPSCPLQTAASFSFGRREAMTISPANNKTTKIGV
jgi:hypothetical protein